MSRYTINIGDDFPMGEEPGTRPSGKRFRTVLRILFFVAVVAIVVGHPVQVALITGGILLLSRSEWWQRRRAEIATRWLRRGSWRDAVRSGAQRWAQTAGQGCCGRGRRSEERGFREFV